MKRKLIQNYALGEVLGEGSFGKVYKGQHTTTNQQFAVKVIPVQKFQENSRLEACSANEIKNLTRIQSSPYIIRFVEMLKTPNNFYFVYEYCNGKTLDSRIREQKKIPEAEAMRIFKQLLQAFKVLNKYNIMHRDLKPDNIFFHQGNVKLGDFGFCKTLMTQDDMTSTMLGSPIYMAPEVLRGEIYTSKADIWSLGVVLYQMLYGICPFQSNSIAKLIAVLDNEQLKFPSNTYVSDSTKDILKKLLVKDQFKRTDWFELLTMQCQETKFVFSVTESLSTKDSQRLNIQMKKYCSVKEQQVMSSKNSTISSQHSMSALKSYQSNISPQKALTFRKKGDQNTNTSKLIKTTSLKVPEMYSNPESPRPRFCEPLKKLETNISSPALQRKLSNKSTKRSDLLNSHNSCLSAIKTSLDFMNCGQQNSNIYCLLILRRVQYVLQRIIDSIGFSQLQLQDILSVCSQQIRQISKQINLIEGQLKQSNIDPSQIIGIKPSLKANYNNLINKKLWYQMIIFFNEEKRNIESSEEQWNQTIDNYLFI